MTNLRPDKIQVKTFPALTRVKLAYRDGTARTLSFASMERALAFTQQRLFSQVPLTINGNPSVLA